MANKLTPREMAKRWDEARPIFVTGIAKAIDKKTRNNRRWVKQADLVPTGVAASKFAAIFKKGLTLHIGGIFKCDLVDDDAGLLMIRHAFGNKQYLWVGAKDTPDEGMLEAIRKYPKENARNESIASEFHRECEDELVELCGMEVSRGPQMSATTPTITRRQERKNAVVNAPSPADHLETYPRSQQRRIVEDLAADAKRKDDLEDILDRIEDEPAAADVIDFMMSQADEDDGAPMKLIQSILERPLVKRTGHILPRTEYFAEAGDRNQQNAVRILNAMMNKSAKLLLPNDGKEGRSLLIKAMINSSVFRIVEMRFNKKYVGKYLMQEEDSGDVRIVMDVKYCQEQHLWYAETVEAEADEIDDRKYSPIDDGDILNVYVGRGSTKLSRCIKQYNQWAELSK